MACMSVSQPTSIAQELVKNWNTMQKKLCFALSLTLIYYWTEASPVKLGTLEFDKLDTDLDDLKYEVEEEDLDDYSKLVDNADSSKSVNSGNENSKENGKTSTFKKKNTANKGLASNYNIEDLKKFFKVAGISDKGGYNIDDVYAAIAALASQTVGAKGTEERKYKKGTKTSGFHRVHHKDEYKKDKEFYEDEETTGNIKKVGGKVLGYKIGSGAVFDKGHYHNDRKKGIYGGEGYLGKGFIDKQYADYSNSQSLEDPFQSDSF